MAKQIRVLAVLFLLLCVFSGTASAFTKDPVKVRLVADNNPETYVDTYAETVEEFLFEQNIILEEKDKVIPDIAAPVTSQMSIQVTRAIEVYVRIDNAGNKNLKKVATPPCMLAVFVKDYSNSAGYEYTFDNSKGSLVLKDGDVVELSSINSRDFETVEPMAFETTYVETDQLERGAEIVETPGVAGERTIVTKVSYTRGQETGREVISDTITKKPVAQVVKVGTKLPVNVKEFGADVFTFKKEFTMTATAYTDDYESTGKRPGDPWFGVTASGLKCGVGVVAVDPDIIPMHTKLYIEGYGYAVAGDVGGAIKGHKVDLFFETAQQCRNYGRRQIKVWVLEDQQ